MPAEPFPLDLTPKYLSALSVLLSPLHPLQLQPVLFEAELLLHLFGQHRQGGQAGHHSITDTMVATGSQVWEIVCLCRAISHSYIIAIVLLK